MKIKRIRIESESAEKTNQAVRIIEHIIRKELNQFGAERWISGCAKYVRMSYGMNIENASSWYYVEIRMTYDNFQKIKDMVQEKIERCWQEKIEIDETFPTILISNFC